MPQFFLSSSSAQTRQRVGTGDGSPVDVTLGGTESGFISGDYVDIVRVGAAVVNVYADTDTFEPKGNTLLAEGDYIRATFDAEVPMWDFDYYGAAVPVTPDLSVEDLNDTYFAYPPVEGDVLSFTFLDDYGSPQTQGYWKASTILPKPPFVHAFGATRLDQLGQTPVVIPPAELVPFPALGFDAYPQTTTNPLSVNWTYEAPNLPTTGGSSFLTLGFNGYFQINLRSKITFQYDNTAAIAGGTFIITARNIDGRVIGTHIVPTIAEVTARDAIFGGGLNRTEYYLNVNWNYFTPGVDQSDIQSDVVHIEVRNYSTASVGAVTVTMTDTEIGIVQLEQGGVEVPTGGGGGVN